MASTRTKTQPVGSSGWIQSEREQSDEYVQQEVEEFSFSVRNELEWLNEHMGEVFSKNQVNFADVFKTPGKLRGKTPRTARIQNVVGPRQPLSDIFAPNAPAPPSAQKTPFFDKVARFQIAEDAENQPPAARPSSRGKSPQRAGKPGNTDSGYHGMTEDEMDIDNKTETATTSSQQSVVQTVPLRDDQPPAQRIKDAGVDSVASSDDSFLSAKEDITSRNASRQQLREEETGDEPTVPADEMEVDSAEPEPVPAAASNAQPTVGNDEAMDQDRDLDEDSSHLQSDVSSPEKPLQRKSSFTFAALPAREPLTAKKSIGPRNSQVDAFDGRTSTLARSFGTKSIGAPQNQDEEEEYIQDKPEETKVHNKTSTQLLHEKINLLGKTKEPRASKSLHQPVLAQAPYPQLPAADPSKTDAPADDSDDDWIAPTKPAQQTAQTDQQSTANKAASPERPAMHQKSISTTHIPSPRPEMAADSRSQKAISVSNPDFAHAGGEMLSTTPAGSPASKKQHDGPLSASKSKLGSLLRSAKNIFASSASASAAAKLEAHNHSPSRSPKRDFSDETKTAAVFNMPGALYSERQLPQSPSRAMSVISAVSTSPSRKTRSSNESEKKREKELKAQQKAADDLEKVREKERQKAAKEKEQRQKVEQAEAAKKEQEAPSERPTSAGVDQARAGDMPPPPPPKTGLAGKLKGPTRLAKPTPGAQQPPRPAPIGIRVPSQSQLRHGQPTSSANLSRSQHQGNAPALPPRDTGRPGSAMGGSIRNTSTAPNHNARAAKAIEAAQRKKEADEKAAQKKEEEKRQRAARAEEQRKAEEERKAAEQQRVHEAKMAAQRQAEKQAADAKRREQQRIDQLRQQEEAQKAKAAHDLAEAIKRERAQGQQQPPHPRGDVGGTLRQLAQKSTVAENPARPTANPAKPPKRVWQPEEDEPVHHHAQQGPRPTGFVQRNPTQNYQQGDANKRRRTNEEEPQQPPAGERQSVMMAQPKRPSNMRKESTLSKFPHGYTHAPPPAAHHPSSMFKATLTAQHQLQHPPKPSHTIQFATGKIPFAENANPPASQGQAQSQQHHPGHENMQPGTINPKFKTPARPAQAPKSAKSSPLYPNGDSIALPEIATDSEDEDSDDEDNTGFRAPSWVASPALRDLLTQQQLVDPESVFGPIGELKMDEVFKNGKNADRLKRFRDRGSSAAWIESGDAVTSAEKRRDMEMRERVVREGGWRFEPNV